MGEAAWTGWTEREALAIEHRRGRDTLFRDGVAVGTWPFVSEISVVGSGEHLAFAVRDRDGWHVVDDGDVGRAWDGIGELRLASDGTLAATTRDAAGWWLVVDGVARGPWPSIHGRGLQVRPGGAFAVEVEDGGGVRVLERAGTGPAFLAVDELCPTTAGVAYTAVAADGEWVVVDGRRLGPWTRATGLVTCGARAAWVADGEVVLDGEVVGDGADPATLAFTDGCDGLGWVAPGEATDAVVLDGEVRFEGSGLSRLRWRGASFAVVRREADRSTLIVDGAPVFTADALQAVDLDQRAGWIAVAPAADGVRVVTERGSHGPYPVVVEAVVPSADGWWWISGERPEGGPVGWTARSEVGDAVAFDLDRWLAAAGPARRAPFDEVRVGLSGVKGP